MSIAIVDYQMGNLRSVQKAFEKVGQQAVITSEPREVLAADKVVLPGVGAFRDAIAELRRRDLVGPLGEVIESGKPFLGICLGLQLLFDVSYEDGEFEGLGLVAGEVRKFHLPSEFKVPHMGWNEVEHRLAAPHMSGIESGTHFYFVHSYYVAPKDPSLIALTADYGGDFCAAIRRNNLFATQFHPEKSQANGLKILDNFAKWDGSSSV